MMKKLIKWINKKKEDDNGFTQFLKLLLSIGSQSWVHAIISTILGILIPIFFDTKHYILFGISIAIIIIDIVYSYICNAYQKDLYIKRKFTSEILYEQSSLIKSIVVEIENGKNWRNSIFKTVSELVCEYIYHNFKDYFHCETRISIEYVYDKLDKNSNEISKYVKMAGRKSGHRAKAKKANALEKRNKYYSYKLFINQNTGINILSKDQIDDEKIWYKNPANQTDVKKYIGIAVGDYDNNKIRFILQIDFLDDFKFGENDNDEAIKAFIEQYLMSYINVVDLSYMLNLNKNKKIGEV